MTHIHTSMRLTIINIRAVRKDQIRGHNIERHPLIIKAVELIFPSSHHVYCLCHLVNNFVKRVMRKYPLHNKKHWSSVFKKAAYAPSRQEFEMHINNIIASMPLARDFIVNSFPESWANAWFLGNRWGVVNNNIAECWNSLVKAARFLPIVGMVDHIRIQIMDMMHKRHETSMRMDKRWSLSKEKILAKTYAESRSLQVSKALVGVLRLWMGINHLLLICLLRVVHVEPGSLTNFHASTHVMP
ncbi:uncharacterized protein [Primulina huaijiensis]|uniref:uncharacterized protein n=1 Tax=Primulina huaijiensis TaxID=1492673 RepID=UPI003CC72544